MKLVWAFLMDRRVWLLEGFVTGLVLDGTILVTCYSPTRGWTFIATGAGLTAALLLSKWWRK